MKLISEEVKDFKVLTEQKDKDKEPEYYLEGIFLQADIKNQNGRIYPMDVMEAEVARYKTTYIDTKRAFGELGHPANPAINLERVSHLITDIWREGHYFKARAKILDTPYGKIVKTMIKEGCQLGVSSRALGSVTTKNGVDYVGDDFQLITAGDIVWEPSAQTAFPKGIMEDVEWELDKETGEYHQVSVKQPLQETVDTSKVSAKQIDEFKKLLDSLKV